MTLEIIPIYIQNEIIENDDFFTEEATLIKDNLIYKINFNTLSISYVSNCKYTDYRNDLFNEECRELVKRYVKF